MSDKVSIIVPVYNARKCIADTIKSCLGQDHEDYELLLVDDGSTDDSVLVMEEFVSDRVRILKNVHDKGAAGARNTGIEEATGRYISFIDADDLWTKDKLSKQVAFMKKHDAAFSFTGYEFADENAHGLGRIVRVPETITYKEALKNTTIFTSTVMFDMDKLSKDDIVMLNFLTESGYPFAVALTKRDKLKPTERKKQSEYFAALPALAPAKAVIETSAESGEGMDALKTLLEDVLKAEPDDSSTR